MCLLVDTDSIIGKSASYLCFAESTYGGLGVVASARRGDAQHWRNTHGAPTLPSPPHLRRLAAQSVVCAALRYSIRSTGFAR